MTTPRPRPKFLNLLQIRLPVTGVVSIAHRLSGVLMVLSIPALIYLLDLSLRGPSGFAQTTAWLDTPWVKLAGVVLAWSAAHHFFAGIRFLLLDLDVAMDKPKARAGAWTVLALGVAALVSIAGGVL